MRSITTWSRLEPRSSATPPTPGSGLAARVYDPAWMLARQWQLGELQGEDAGSPASARIHASVSRLTRYRPGADPSADAVELAPGALLEAVVESEPDDPEGARWAAEAGAHFLALLRAGGAPAAVRNAFVAEYRLPDPALASDPSQRAALALLRRGGSLDGRALLAAARAAGSPGTLPARPPVAPGQRERVRAALALWLAWYPAAAASAWQPERMEYRFAAAGPAPAGGGELALEAPEYQGGRLDWHDLRVGEQNLGAAADAAPEQIMRAILPTPVSYPGMPANRWWEFEDARVWFGAIEAEAGDVARMLLVEFATVYGNDWFLAPLELDAGALAHVEAVVVQDTFGQSTLVRPTERARAGVGATPWRMFRVSGAEPELLVVPSVATGGLEGAPLEDVLLVRDEMANLGWAIERRVVGASGVGVDRYERSRAQRAAQPPPAGPPLPAYRLASDVPEHWIPLVAESDGLRSIRLTRGTIATGDGRTFPPLGRLLEPDRELSLFEEEVPRSGLALTRCWQLARRPDGTTQAWIGRRKRPAPISGERASGLSFDGLVPPPA